jgi:hypothetical protein
MIDCDILVGGLQGSIRRLDSQTHPKTKSKLSYRWQCTHFNLVDERINELSVGVTNAPQGYVYVGHTIVGVGIVAEHSFVDPGGAGTVCSLDMT